VIPQAVEPAAGADEQPPVVATSLDSIAWDRFADRYLGIVQPLTVLGAFGIYFFGSNYFYWLVQHWREREWIIIIALSGATLVFGVWWLGIHLTRHGQRNGTRILGWLIVGNCAFVGGGIIVGLLVVIGYALVTRLW
jgi:hypothetical protein